MRIAIALSVATVVAGCSTQSDEYQPTGAPDETDPSGGDGGKEDSPAPGPEVPLAKQSADIGQFFMVDHYGVDPAGFADIRNKIKTKNLGAIILWNPTNASGETLRTMIRAYSEYAKANGRDELFYAADQEELHTQRFASANGFTSLVQGSVLGSVSSSNRDRLCELHARITSREMASVGMNMSLGTVSDIFTSDSGTRGMFRTRAIDDQPENVAPCVTAMTKAYAQEGHVVYITKHFPGLGNASGNTDVDASVHTRSATKAAMERELLPYRQASAAVTAANGWNYFGAMISHASYPVIDGGGPATLSSKLVTDFMRGPSTTQLSLGGKDSSGAATSFPGMNFRGVTVSDAFWTWGATKGLGAIERERLMARAFLAGIDILMIAKNDFTGGWGYFQEVYADMLPPAEQQALLAATGFASWSDLRAKFRARITESAARIRAVKAAVGQSTSFMKTGAARDASTDLVNEYRRLAN